MKNVIIIGASHAAAEAISSLRKAGWKDKITLVGDEKTLPYQRPPLSKAYYQGAMSAEKLAIKNTSFYDKANVELRLGRRAELINREAKTVQLDDGSTLNYSSLIIATGTRARRLPIEGEQLPCVKYLRTLEDVDNIRQSFANGKKLLIIGAGYIGLEVAASAIKQGADVTVLEAQERVLARVTSPVISQFYQDLHQQHGVDIRLGVTVEKLSENDNDPTSYFAELSDGKKIQFDCAIVGIGVVPNSELAKQADLHCDNGIVVDEYTRTQDPNIYAVGDCSNHPSLIYQRRVRLESVPNAVAQAKTAALAIGGKDVAYNQVPWFWSDQYDIKLQTAGLLQGYDDTLVDGNIEEKKFTVSYLKNGQLIALDAINSPAEFMRARKKISEELIS